ncbi:ABC transporter substrate-binding protein [candidate division WOR-3 bacterium]|nr:ABC transporter substrate-binding protein [candidate division WOR-3 bacterium]
MKTETLNFIVIITLVFLSCTPLRNGQGQQTSYVEDLNRIALEKYAEGEYQDAIIIFNQILSSSPSDSLRFETQYMIALSAYMIGDMPKSEKALSDLLQEEDLPAKNKITALRLLARVFSDEEAFKESSETILMMYDLIPDGDPFKEIALNELNDMTSNLSSTELKDLYESNRETSLSPRILFFASTAAFSEGDITESERLWDLLKTNHQNSEFLERRPPFLRQINSKLIGVIMPLTGQHAQYSQEVINGIKLALKGSGFEILIYDSYGEPSKATQCAKELIDEKGVIAIIGPLLSSSSIDVAEICVANSIPMITPTATQSGISDIGSYIFQLNRPETDEELFVLATWAVEKALYSNFCVVGGEGYEEDLQKFSDYVTSLGGHILGSWTFPRGTSDFTRISSEITLEEPDAVFISSSVTEIVQLSPTLRFIGCNARFLGSSIWNNDEVVRYGEDAVVGAVFPGKGYFGSETIGFVNDYTQEYGREPSRVARLGYDAMRILIVASQGKSFESSKQLGDAITSLRIHSGVSGQIILEPGSRIAHQLLTIQRGRILPLNEQN